MIQISTNMCTDKLDDVIKERNNTYNSTIKMKCADVKSSTYVEICC